MKACCANCEKKHNIKEADYSQGGCKTTDVNDGFCCDACVNEGIVFFMKGVDPNTGFCEMYSGKGEIKW